MTAAQRVGRTETIDPIADPRWARLVSGRRGGLFLGPRYLDCIRATYGFTVRARVMGSTEGLTAGVAYCELDDPLGPRIVSTPFCDVSPPVVADLATWQALVDPLLSRDWTTSFRTFADPAVLSDDRLQVTRSAIVSELTLDPGVEPAASYGAHTRRHLARARRSGLTFVASADRCHLRAFFLLHLQLRRQKYGLLAQPYAFFEALWERYVEVGDGTLIVALDQGQVAAGALVLVDGVTASYKFAASAPEYRRDGVNHAVADAVIGWAAHRGLTKVEFGRSDLDQAGLVRFKSNLGAVPQEVTVHRRPVPPAGAAASFAAELQRLTAAMTAARVPDHLCERAGATLYRYFA